MNNKYIDDCYNRDYHIEYGNHDDPRMVNIFHIAYIYLPSNPLNRVEVIIRDHDDINNPCFYILNEDRSKELYKVSLFDNNTVDGLSKEDKIYLNEFIRSDRVYTTKRGEGRIQRFKELKNAWLGMNLKWEEETPYDNITDIPYYE